jgi:hypothetical protein
MSKPSPPAKDGTDWNEAFAAVLRLVKARRSVVRDATVAPGTAGPPRTPVPARTYFAGIERATVSDTE